MSRPPRTGPPGRGRMLITPLRAVAMAAFVLAVIGSVAPTEAAERAAGVMLAALIGVPLVRVGFFSARWWQLGDRRYAIVTALLLAEIGVSAALSAL